MIKKILFALWAVCATDICIAQTPCGLDNTFANSGKLVADNSRLGEHILVQADGKILVACNPFGNGDAYIKRFNANGTVDASYGNGGIRTVAVADIATNITGMAAHNGNVYICGTTTTNIGGTTTYVFAAALDANGAFINTFGVNGISKFNTTPKLYLSRDICISASGEIYICGVRTFNELFVMKLNQNGTLNNSYDGDGIVYVNTNNNQHWYEVVDMDLDKNNKIVLCGKKSKANNVAPNFWNILMMRFSANGSLDATFATGGIGLYNSSVTNLDESKKILVTPAGDYYICGDTYDGVDYDYTVVKIKSDGSVDNSFANNGWALHDLDNTNEIENPLNGALMPDGRILITGNQGSGDTVYFALLMLKSDGSRDTVFAADGVFKNIFDVNNNSSSSGMAVTSDGKIVLAGYTRTCVNGNCGPLSMAVSRYLGGDAGAALPVAEISWQNEMHLFPNPVSEERTVNVYLPQGLILSHVQLYDISGRHMPVAFDKQSNKILLGQMATGFYNCMLYTNKGITAKRISVR